MFNSNEGMRSLYNFENKRNTIITVIVRHNTGD